MKANAQEKIYIEVTTDGTRYYRDVVKEQRTENSDIEYTRTDAFIENACEYISEHIEYYMKKEKTCNVPLCPLFATKSFIENFRKYMKGE